MKFEGLKVMFDNSVHHYLGEGILNLWTEQNSHKAVIYFDEKIDVELTAVENEEVILVTENLYFKCNDVLMIPEERKLVMTLVGTEKI